MILPDSYAKGKLKGRLGEVTNVTQAWFLLLLLYQFSQYLLRRRCLCAIVPQPFCL